MEKEAGTLCIFIDLSTVDEHKGVELQLRYLEAFYIQKNLVKMSF